MSICPRFVLAVSNMLMLSLLSVPLVICLARVVEPAGALALLPGPSLADRLATGSGPARV